jgi:hypothetical protein
MVSAEEQDQIHGRLLRERGELRAKLAALTAKATDTCHDIEIISAALRNAQNAPTPACGICVHRSIKPFTRSVGEVRARAQRDRRGSDGRLEMRIG